MTEDKIALRTLLEKSADADFLREMIGFAAHRLMELDVEGLTGAPWGERSPDRLAQRNGYRDRLWETRAGAVELRIELVELGGLGERVDRGDALAAGVRRDLIMPGVWGARWRLHIHSTRCSGGLPSWSPISSTTAVGI